MDGGPMTAIIINRSGVISTGDAQRHGKAEIALRSPKRLVESNDRWKRRAQQTRGDRLMRTGGF
jgi:hypothetical protein